MTKTMHVCVPIKVALERIKKGKNLFDAPPSEVLKILTDAQNEGKEFWSGCSRMDKRGMCRGHIKVDPSQECVQCGSTREAVKRGRLYCVTVTYEGETDYEWPRHRFKPYSEKELARIKSDEDEYVRQMGEFADFVKKEELSE
jgi:hypothetical protein